MESKHAYDVFISYLSADAAVVEDLVRILTDAGLKVWFDKWELVPGQVWEEVLSEAIELASATVVCVGPSGMEQWRKMDGPFAFERASPTVKPLFPVLLPGAQPEALPSFLLNRNWVDLRDGIDDAGKLARLIFEIGRYGKEQEVVQQRADPTGIGEAVKKEAKRQRMLRARLADSDLDCSATFASQNEVALKLSALGRKAEAESMLRKIWEESRAKLGPNHPDTLTSQNNLAAALSDLGRTAEAEELFQRAWEASKADLGPGHPDTLASKSNFATTLNALGRKTEAVGMFRQLWEESLTNLGPDHPSTLTSQNNLAGTLSDLGRIAEAEELFRRAWEARKANLGPDHPDTLASQNNLAATLKSLGRKTEAEGMFRQVWEKSKAKFGPDHPSALASQKNLAVMLRDLGRMAEAEELFRPALEARRAMLGPDQSDTPASQNNLSRTPSAEDFGAKARKVYENDVFEAWQAKPDHTVDGICTGDDENFMRRAISLSRSHMEARQGPFGAVVVKDGVIIGEGWSQVISSNDPTAHAEVMAIRAACRRLGTYDLSGAVIYCSCEPCPMCLAAIYWAKLSRVYYANTLSDAVAIGLDESHFHEGFFASPYAQVQSMVRILEGEAFEVFKEWKDIGGR